MLSLVNMFNFNSKLAISLFWDVRIMDVPCKPSPGFSNKLVDGRVWRCHGQATVRLLKLTVNQEVASLCTKHLESQEK